MTSRRERRAGYTLLEIMLSLTIAIILLSALYAAVGHQLRQAQQGRDMTGQTTLARSVVNRIENDVVGSLSLCDPGRFRNAAKDAEQKQASLAATGQTPTAPATTTPPTTTPPTTTPPTTTTTPDAETADSTVTDEGKAGFTGPVTLPYGVVGDSTSLTLFMTKVPSELYSSRESEQGQLVSDVRRITYWMAADNLGMCRQEIRLATAQEALVPGPPGGDVKNYLLAPEIKSMEFRYFDGTDWADSWDSTALGDDGVTPIGAPRAVEVRLGVLPPGGKDGDELKYHRHVILIKTANGITQASPVAP